MGALKQEADVPAAATFPPRPRTAPDLAAVRAEINKRFSKSLEYLGR